MTTSALSAPPGTSDAGPSGRSARVWGESWRMVLAGAVGLVALVVVFGYSLEEGLVTDQARAGLVLLGDVALGVTALALLPVRRLAPVPIGVILGLIAGFSILSVGAAGIASWMLSVAVVEWTGASFVGSAASLADSAVVLLGAALVLGVLTVVGLYIGQRRELVSSLRERARLVEEEQARRLAGEREQERSRIAHEMHDVLAHRLSLVALHAGALQHRDDLDRAETARTAGVVRDNARAALDELRGVLGVLRDPDAGDAPERPQPTLLELPALVEQARADGTRIDLEVAEETRTALADVPSSTGRHAFRILQEALTNARRHAPGLPVRIVLAGRPGAHLRLTVANPLPPDAPSTVRAGHGLLGIQERARSLGGEHVLHRTADEHTVEVVLPWATS